MREEGYRRVWEGDLAMMRKLTTSPLIVAHPPNNG
jgi:hypothetical protein